MTRIDRLVTFAIHQGICAFNVGRQRHVAEFFQFLTQQALHQPETEKRTLAPGHFHPGAIFQENDGSRAGCFADAQLREALNFVNHSFQHDFHPPAGLFLPEQPCRDDPGVVEHQQVALSEQTGQLAEVAVTGLPAVFRQVQKPAARTLRQRLLRNKFRWKIEMKVAAFQR
jgi:hypothetical protein